MSSESDIDAYCKQGVLENSPNMTPEETACAVAMLTEIKKFEDIADKAELCTRYQAMNGALYTGACEGNARNGWVEQCMARMGWRNGVGYPAVTSAPAYLNQGTALSDSEATVCKTPGMFNDEDSYMGLGTIFTASVECIPSCASMCTVAECSDATKTASQLLALTSAAVFYFAR